MFERFTDEARGVVVRAQQEAVEQRHPCLGTEHLLLGLLSPLAGISHAVLVSAGVQPSKVRADIDRFVAARPPRLDAADAQALLAIGIDLDAVLARVEATFGPDAHPHAGRPSPRRPLRRRWQGGATRFSGRARKVLELSLREARELGDRHIGSEHLLLGLLREPDGLASRILVDNGVQLERLRQQTLEARHRAA